MLRAPLGFSCEVRRRRSELRRRVLASSGAPAVAAHPSLWLLVVIFSLACTHRAASAPAAVGAYIGAAYWLTSSTSFANPSSPSVARSPTLSPGSAHSARDRIIAQALGGSLAVIVIRARHADVTHAAATMPSKEPTETSDMAGSRRLSSCATCDDVGFGFAVVAIRLVLAAETASRLAIWFVYVCVTEAQESPPRRRMRGCATRRHMTRWDERTHHRPP